MSVIVRAIVGGETYTLSGGNPYWFLSLVGGGLPPIRRLKERGPQQHGSTDVGFQLDERLINLALLIEAPTLPLADTYRDNLAEILKPVNDTPIKLQIERDDTSKRQIDCFTIGTVDFPNTLQQRMGPSQQVVIQFEAADPIPYDPELQTVVFNLATTDPSDFQVPTMVPTVYSTGIAIAKTQSIAYAGKWETFPIIYVTGPASNTVITNETTGRVLDFTGTTIPGGLTYIINLRYGSKSIIDSNGINRINTLTTPSSLARWSIVPSVNDIRVNIAGANGDTEVRLEYYNRYISF